MATKAWKSLTSPTILLTRQHAWYVPHPSDCSLPMPRGSLTQAGSQVLATAIPYCPTLRILHVDGNPIGRSGARAILRGLSKRGTAYSRSMQPGCDIPPWMIPRHRNVDVTMVGCNIEVRCGSHMGGCCTYIISRLHAQKEELHLFDPEDPGGEYQLNLENPYDRVRGVRAHARNSMSHNTPLLHVRLFFPVRVSSVTATS